MGCRDDQRATRGALEVSVTISICEPSGAADKANGFG
jgi:hypothetical protein